MDAAWFEALVSGRRQGPGALLARGALRVASIPYRWEVARRNRRFDRGIGVTRLEVPVVSVGNLTLGGTGKTPAVAWIARWYRARGVRVALVSRGYGSRDGQPNDEALELERALPDVPHVQDADRVAGARLAIEEFESQLILLDDGFQHRRLARDLDLVLLDALVPDGYGHVFPRGTLREPLSELRRAQVVAISRVDAVEPARLAEIRDMVARLAPRAERIELRHAPHGWAASDGRQAALAEFGGKRVAAFCGIGNPQAFHRTLEQAGTVVTAFRALPDHYAYERKDVEALAAWASGSGAEAAVCTMKDLVKLGVARLGNLPLWALEIRLEVTAGLDALEAKLRELLPRDG